MNTPHTLTTKRIALLVLVVFTIGFAVGFAVSRKYTPCVELPVISIERDTVTVRDTINGKIVPPKLERVIRVDTARINLKPVGDGKYKIDTTKQDKPRDSTTTPRIGKEGEVLIPISSKVYETENYRAVVSGWRPSLDTIELYRDTRTIRETVTKVLPPKPKRWALVVGAGTGYGPDQKLTPYIGATLGFVLISK